MAHEQLIDLGKGEPDFHTPDHIKRAGHAAIDENFTKYTPQPGILQLREAIARKLNLENGIGVAPQQIVVSCGGKHAVDHAIRAIVGPGDQVIMMAPYWFAYPEQVGLCGGDAVFLPARPERHYVPDPTEIRAAISGKTKLIVINTPNNPTGAVYPRAVLEELGRLACAHDLMVLADEVYEKILFAGAEHVSLASLGAEIAARTVTVNSVSKTHAMTGWRIGYAALPGHWAERVTKIQSVSTSAPSAISQRAALAALTGDQTHVAAMTCAYAERRRVVLERLAGIPLLSAVPPSGTFYCFVDVSSILGRTANGRVLNDADRLAEALRDTVAVSVVSGVGFGAPRHIRISFAVAAAALNEGFDRIDWFVANCLAE